MALHATGRGFKSLTAHQAASSLILWVCARGLKSCACPSCVPRLNSRLEFVRLELGWEWDRQTCQTCAQAGWLRRAMHARRDDVMFSAGLSWALLAVKDLLDKFEFEFWCVCFASHEISFDEGVPHSFRRGYWSQPTGFTAYSK